MKQLALSIFVIVVYALAGLGHAATLDSARQLYDSKDYRAAADQYGTLLSLNWPKTKLGELYDAYTECLMVTGQYDLAETKIDVFIKLMPGDSVVSKLTTRKQQIEAVKVISTIPQQRDRASADQQYAKELQAGGRRVSQLVVNRRAAGDNFDQLTESLFSPAKTKRPARSRFLRRCNPVIHSAANCWCAKPRRLLPERPFRGRHPSAQ